MGYYINLVCSENNASLEQKETFKHHLLHDDSLCYFKGANILWLNENQESVSDIYFNFSEMFDTNTAEIINNHYRRDILNETDDDE